MKSLWNGLPWYLKIVFPIAVVLIVISKISGFIGGVIENKKRKEVDNKLKELDNKKDKLESETAVDKKRISDLEKERDEKVKKSDDIDPVDYHNNR